MPFPALTINNGTDAQTQLINQATAAGFVMPSGGLSQQDAVAAITANQLLNAPAGQTIAVTTPGQFGTVGSVVMNYGGAAAAASTASSLVKVVTGIADNSATTVLTITVPNAAHAALIQVTIVGQAGAAGAIGAFEDVTAVTYNIAVCRTPGVAMGATVSTAFGSAAAVVAGAGTMTTVGAITLNGEGVTAVNTGSFKATIDQSSTSTNHRCLVFATILNANASGITLS